MAATARGMAIEPSRGCERFIDRHLRVGVQVKLQAYVYSFTMLMVKRDGLWSDPPKNSPRSAPRGFLWDHVVAGSGRAAREDVLLDDRMDAPVSINHLGDAEVDTNRN